MILFEARSIIGSTRQHFRHLNALHVPLPPAHVVDLVKNKFLGPPHIGPADPEIHARRVIAAGRIFDVYAAAKRLERQITGICTSLSHQILGIGRRRCRTRREAPHNSIFKHRVGAKSAAPFVVGVQIARSQRPQRVFGCRNRLWRATIDLEITGQSRCLGCAARACNCVPYRIKQQRLAITQRTTSGHDSILSAFDKRDDCSSCWSSSRVKRDTISGHVTRPSTIARLASMSVGCCSNSEPYFTQCHA